jgi:hypothetical protein
MAQKNTFTKFVGFALIAGTAGISVSSCVDQLYDLSNGISKDMELLGDSLAIPIGSTDTIRLGDYLDSKTLSVLKVMEDDGYALSMKDSLDPITISIPQDKLNIVDQHIGQSVSVDFGNINLNGFSIPSVKAHSSVGLGLDSYALGTFSLPPINNSTTARVVMHEYALPNPQLEDQTSNADFPDLLSHITLPPNPGIPNVLIPISNDQPAVSVGTSGNIIYSIQTPTGISNIKDIELSTGAELEVSIELNGAASTLHSGAIVPNLTINPNGFFVFKTPPADGKITFEPKDSLTKANGYKMAKTYDLVGLNVSGDPQGGYLNISKAITAIGSMVAKDITVYSDNLDDVSKMDLLVRFSIKGVTISSLNFTIDPLTTTVPSGTANLKLSTSVPDQIAKINTVHFQAPSIININISAAHLPTMESANIQIKNLNIAFPKELVFEPTTGLNTSTNEFTLTNENFDPASGKHIELRLREANFSDVSLAGGLDWNGTISYGGSIGFGGEMKSKYLTSSTQDAEIKVAFSSSMAVESATVTTKDIVVDNIAGVNVNFPIKATIADQVQHLGTLKLQPDTKIHIHLDKPKLPLTLQGRGLNIVFPDLFEFNPALPMNTLSYNNEAIPDSIVLTLDALKIDQNLVNGVLDLNPSISVSGGIGLVGGVVNSKDIESLNNESMTVDAFTSKIGIRSTSVVLKDLSTTVSDSINLDIENTGIPSEVVSIDSLLLKDNATIDLLVNITDMPNLSNPLKAKVTVDFPDMFLFTPGSVNSSNQLVIDDVFDKDGKLSKSIGIRGLKLDGKPLNGTLSIHKQLAYTATVSVEAPTVNSDDLQGKTISVAVDAQIKGIAFKDVYGKLDPQIEPIHQDVSLGNIDERLQNGDVVLDVTKPVIALNTESNLGLPIDASVKVIPIVKGVERTADQQAFTLHLPKVNNPLHPKQTRFWIAPDSAGMPQGYQFIQTEIQKLFKIVPDNIRLDASVRANTSVQHYFDLTAPYSFKLAYEVTVPMAFGQDMRVHIEQEVAENLDPQIGEIAAETGSLEILGTVVNSIPLELSLALVPLDEDGVRIPVDTVSQVINAGGHDGSGVPTTLKLKLEDKDDLLKDLRSFLLIFTASSNTTVAGTPIKADNFIKADLKVRVNGGINLKKLLEKDDHQ